MEVYVSAFITFPFTLFNTISETMRKQEGSTDLYTAQIPCFFPLCVFGLFGEGMLSVYNQLINELSHKQDQTMMLYKNTV